MMKKIIASSLTLVMALSIGSMPVFARHDMSRAKKVVIPRVQIVRPNQRLTAAQQELLRLQNAKARLEMQIQVAIIRAKSQLGRQDLQQQLTKVQDQLTALATPVATSPTKQVQVRDQTKAQLQMQLTDIDAALTDLDQKIAAATDATAKQKLIDQKTALQGTSTARKDAINKYLSDLQAIWAAQDQVSAQQKAAHTVYLTAMLNARKVELTAQLAAQAVAKTDAQIEAEVRAQFQKQVDALNAQIAALQPPVTTPTTPTVQS